jgi:hypothetical protein
VPVPRWLRIDAPLPPSGLARWATVAGLTIGGLIAALVVAMGVAAAWGALRG